MGYFGILLGFLLLMVLAMCNVSVFISAIAASLAVMLCCGLPVVSSFLNDYYGAFGSIVAVMLPMYIFGAILARLYESSGAAQTIADTICRVMFGGAKDKRRVFPLAILAVILASALLCYGGINAAVAIITIYPVAMHVFEQANIPKRFILGAICGGAFTFALSGPGSPQPTNIVAMEIGTSSYCGLIAGIAGAVAEILVMVFALTLMSRRAVERGERFSYGEKDVPQQKMAARPSFLAAVIPFIVLLVLFNVFSLHIAVASLAACVVATVLFFPYLKREKVLRAVNVGALSSVMPACTIGAVNGFAAIIQLTPEYDSIIHGLLNLKASPVLLLIICISFLCGITGGSTTGTQIAMPVLAGPLVEKGLSLVMVHRVGVYAATMIDSLPHSGAVNMAVSAADLTMREAYPAVFCSTVIATTAGTIVVALTMYLFPFLP